jgi:hypothetical protein
MTNNLHLHTRFPLLLGLLFLALGGGLVWAPPASARFAGCRGDPIIRMSNGDQIRVAVDIATDAANVGAITYIVHAAPGLSIDKVIYTARGLGLAETVNLVNDEQPGYYWIETLVNVAPTIAVSTSVSTNAYSMTASGYGQDDLSVTLSP